MLENISLSFFHGAKIGVLGLNGSGKSTLLRIMAGVDDGYRGEAQLKPGATVGPARAGAAARRVQGRARQRRGRRPRAARPGRPLQRGRRQLLGRDRRRVRPPPGPDRRGRRLEPRHDARHGDGRPAAAARRRRRDQALRRRAPPGRALPPAAAGPRPAAARRADQPPRRRVGRLARAAPRGVQGRGRRGHPRPLLPRQRRRLDPRARPRPRDPVPGQLLVLARAEDRAARAGEAHRQGAREDARRRARVGAREPQGPAQEVEGPPRPLRGAAGRGPQREARRRPDPHPGRRRASATR